MSQMHAACGTIALSAMAWLSPNLVAQVCDGGVVKLLPQEGGTADRFGESVAVSDELGIAAVGASFADPGTLNAGGAYTFHLPSGPQAVELVAPDAAQLDAFGRCIAVGGSYVVVGAHRDDDNGIDSGSAYLFDATTGAFMRKILPDDGAASDIFGFSVAASGGLVLVGANGANTVGQEAGAAYLFDAASGAQQWKLQATDASANDYFGFSVGLDDTVAIVGAIQDEDSGPNTGAAYLFDATTGSQLHKLVATDAAAGSYFGWSVAIGGNIAVVGAPSADAAYLFDVSTGQQLHKLVPLDLSPGAGFGRAVGISGGSVVIGAPFAEMSTGAAYLFDAASGSQLGKLTAPDGVTQDGYGAAVGVSQNTIVVGASGDDPGGSAYLMSPNSCTWTDFGCSLPGDLGSPVLSATGVLSEGSAGSVHVQNVPGSALTTYFLATESNPVPFKGGVLKPNPFLEPLYILLSSPSGDLEVSFTTPSGIPSGTEVWLQWAAQDSTAAAGVSLSNAIRGVVP